MTHTDQTPDVTLLDHCLLLLFPFLAEKPLDTRDLYQRGFSPCVRGDDDSLGLYLTPAVKAALHGRRFHQQPDLCCQLDESGTSARLETVELADVSADDRPGLGLLTLVLRLSPPSDAENTADALKLAQLLSLADTARLRGPLYPGQRRPTWILDGSQPCPLEGVLDTLVPGAQPIFDDPRLFTFLYLATDEILSRDERFACVAVDPPGMPPPPQDMLRHFEQKQCYRRWAGAGTHWGFTHYSGALLHEKGAPAWLAGLVRNHYLDLAGWVVTVAARRRLLARESLGSEQALFEHLVRWEAERFSEQDQGRQLARLWLEVIETDYHDLTLARELSMSGQ